MKKKLLVLVVVFVLSFSFTTPMFAVWWASTKHVAEESFQGGTWKHNYTQNGAGPNDYRMHYSYYYHGTKNHRSGVLINGWEYNSPAVAGGSWSQINAPSMQIKNISFGFYQVDI
jgi:lactococcin 972 family bacteriocin